MTTATASPVRRHPTGNPALPCFGPAPATDWMPALDSFRPGIQSFIRRKGFTAEEAEDLTQETLVRAYQHRDHFRGTFLRAWLFRIASNVAVDYVRRQRLHTVPLDDLSGVLPCSEDPAMYWERTELERGLIAMVDSLPVAQQQIIRLRYLEGYSLAEIAERVQCTPLAARLRVFRAVDALRKKAARIDF